MRLLNAVLSAALCALVAGAGFDGIPGDYCSIRTPVTCCPSRDDDCTVPILGNHLCYCDMFCDRSDGGDCCPDFERHCIGGGACDYAGSSYSEGDTSQQNCKSCTCRSDRWQCESTVCLIQGELLGRVNEGRYTWTASNYSKFWGKSLDDGVKYRLGTIYPESSVRNMKEIMIKEQQIPDEFDAREKWPTYIHPVRDQGDCGSSWVFSTTATSADRLAIMSEGKLNAELSAQHLLSCGKHKQSACEGGYLDRGWWYIRKLGVVDAGCYPYESGSSGSQGDCRIPKTQFTREEGVECPSPGGSTKLYKMTPPYRVSRDERDIQTEILVNGPVQATFLVHEDFFMYKGGVYQWLDIAQNKAQGYHSVRILGYGALSWGTDRSSGAAVKYWLCANSWGSDWGEQGFFRIVRGENHCEIESFVIGSWGKGSKKRRRRFKLQKLKRRRLRRL